MMEEPVVVNKGDDHDHDHEPLDLPPGFRFHPTDEEIITCYLTEKVLNRTFSATAIGEADFNKCEPWDLPSKYYFNSLILSLFFFFFILFSLNLMT